MTMTVSQRYCGSSPSSQHQMRNQCSFLSNGGPPYYQISGGIPLSPVALPFFICAVALILLSFVGK